RRDVDLGGRERLARPLDGLAWPEQRLGGDARIVGALPAHELAFHDRDPKPTRGERAGAVLARRAAADADHVEVSGVLGAVHDSLQESRWSWRAPWDAAPDHSRQGPAATSVKARRPPRERVRRR